MGRVRQVHQGRGEWDVTLDAPSPTLRRILDEGGHVAVTAGPVDHQLLGDGLLGDARHVGIVLDVDDDNQASVKLSGQGLAWHLGDHEGKGRVYLTEPLIVGNSYTFAAAVRDLLPISVGEGTLYSLASGGTYTAGSHLLQTPRQAIDHVCSLLDAAWRIRPDATDGAVLDAGDPGDLWPDTTVLVAKGAAGREPSGLVGADATDLKRRRDIGDLTTKVAYLPEGQGEPLVGDMATAEVNPADVPYRDLRGNTLEVVRVVSGSQTSRGNAQAAADLQLNRFRNPRQAHELDVDRYDIAGILEPGVTLLVYDPLLGLFDQTNLQHFDGRRIWPVAVTLEEVTWQIVDGMGVYYRDADGGWHDLTDYATFGSGTARLDIGRTLSRSAGEPVGVRLQDSDDGRTPATPAFTTPFATGVYLDAEGRTRAHVTVAWTTPILNDDGSAVTDGSHIEVAFRESGATSWDSRSAGWGEGDLRLTGLDPGVSYEFRARAVDIHGNRSAWAATHTQAAEADTIAPSTPAAPTVAGNALYIQVTHELGQASGGTFNLEDDLDHLEVHVGTVSTFTPDATTKVGEIAANAGMLAAGTAVVATFEVADDTQRWVKVIAVDHAGNASAASAGAAVTAALLDSQHISELTVTKLSAGDLTVAAALGVGGRVYAGEDPTGVSPDSVWMDADGLHAAVAGDEVIHLDPAGNSFIEGDLLVDGTVHTRKLIVGSFDNLVQNPGFEAGLGPHNVPGPMDLSQAPVRSGANSVFYNGAAGPLTTVYLELNGNRTSPVLHQAAAEGDKFYFEAWCRPGGTGPWNRITPILWFFDGAGVSLGNSISYYDPNSAGNNNLTPFEWNRIAVHGTAPAGTAYVVAVIRMVGDGETGNYNIDDCYTRRKVAGDILASGSIIAGEDVSSANFLAGSDGWRISGSGDAEFNNVTVRGTVQADAGYLATLDVSGRLTFGAGGEIFTASGFPRIKMYNSINLEWFASNFGGGGYEGPGYVSMSGQDLSNILDIRSSQIANEASYVRMYPRQMTVFVKTNSANGGSGTPAEQLSISKDRVIARGPLAADTSANGGLEAQLGTNQFSPSASISNYPVGVTMMQTSSGNGWDVQQVTTFSHGSTSRSWQLAMGWSDPPTIKARRWAGTSWSSWATLGP